MLPLTDTAETVAGSLTHALLLDAGRAILEQDWFSWSGPHGGLVAALCLRAGLPLLGEGRSPRSLTVLLLETAAAGTLELTASPVREGGSSAVVAVEAGAPGAGTVARATLVGGRSRGTSALSAVPAPAVPAPEDCPELELPVELVPFTQHLQLRAATPARPMSGGDLAELVAWVRFRADVPLDAAALTVLVDAMPPGLYGAASVPIAVPTVEITVAFAETPEVPDTTGWVLLRISTRTAAGGWCVDDSEVWDQQGRLLAQARQTRRVLGEWQ
ncbi:thioesterase family protein [Nocardioides rubriscoriae]|uniref:thioesterase family protein n=1 Tax=Nocardioides rubriscoriae TaxID=642762 RepID=UPI0014780E44|nr:thioesterase family protein [Nocardioides rubriscoriae]